MSESKTGPKGNDVENRQTWRVGQLAKQTGVSVRALHYYDEIGLLKPSSRNRANHRLYNESDVARLQQIISLRQLGVALDDIAGWLKSDEISPLGIVEMQLRQVRDEMAEQQRLAHRLEYLAERLRANQPIAVERFIDVIEETTMIEKYYTPEQRQELEQRRQMVGEERIQQVQQEWQELFAGFRAAKDKGADPSDDSVLDLARRARDLVSEFTGGNPGIEKSLGNMYEKERPSMLQQWGIDQDLAEYMDRARAALIQSEG